jgi:hypothetical protein
MTTKRNTDQRTRRTEGADQRAPREMTADVSRAEGMLSQDEALALIRSEFTQESLPQIKPPAGWHYCWLSSNSQYDPIHKRLRLGYMPVPFTELVETGQASGFENYKSHDGDFAGCVKCNEMLLFKLPLERYQLIMQEFHHDMPLREEESIRQKAKPVQRDSKGRELVDFDDEDEGMRSLAKAAPVPSFI